MSGATMADQTTDVTTDLTLWDEVVTVLWDESGYGSGAGYTENVWPVYAR